MAAVRYKQIAILTGCVFLAGFGLKKCADSDDPLKGQKPLSREEMQKRGQEYAEKMRKMKEGSANASANPSAPSASQTSDEPKRSSASIPLSSTPVPIPVANPVVETVVAQPPPVQTVTKVAKLTPPPAPKPVLATGRNSLYLRTSLGPTLWVRLNDTLDDDQIQQIYSRLQKSCLKTDATEDSACAKTVTLPSDLYSQLARCEGGSLISPTNAALMCKTAESCQTIEDMEVAQATDDSFERVLGEIEAVIVPVGGCKTNSRSPASSTAMRIQKVLRTVRKVEKPAPVAEPDLEEIVLGERL